MLEQILETLERVDLEKPHQSFTPGDVVELQAIVAYCRKELKGWIEEREAVDVCAYCGTEMEVPNQGCCGEVHHEIEYRRA